MKHLLKFPSVFARCLSQQYFSINSSYSHLSQNFHKVRRNFHQVRKLTKVQIYLPIFNETMRNKVGAKSVSIVTIKAMLQRIVIFSRCGSTSLKEPMNQRLQYHKPSEITNYPHRSVDSHNQGTSFSHHIQTFLPK